MAVVLDDPIFANPPPPPPIGVPEVPTVITPPPSGAAQYPYFHPDCIISDFEYVDWLVLGRAPETLKRGDREAMYVVMKDYKVKLRIDGQTRYIVVPAGMTTDLVSVPKWARRLVGRVGPHLEACIVHDWLYIAWQLQDRMPTKNDWRWANKVLYAGMKAANVPGLIQKGVKLAMEFPFLSWGVFKGRDRNLFIDLGEMEL